MTLIEKVREQLLGRYFSNKSELRHIAEGAGFSFVPVEFLSYAENTAMALLKPKGVEEIVVRGERSMSWQPFYITSVEPALGVN